MEQIVSIIQRLMNEGNIGGAEEALRRYGDEIGAPRDVRICKLERVLAAADKMNEVLNASSSGHFWADIADAQEIYLEERARVPLGAK